MNTYCLEAIENIKKAAKTYQHECTKALMKYRQSMEKADDESRLYKDPSAFLAGKKAGFVSTARNTCVMAANVFEGEVSAELPGLKEELAKHISTRPNASFLECLNVYRSFHINPSKLEIEALLKQAGGSTLSLRALNHVLKGVGSDYRISFPDTSVFEADLKFLERLGSEESHPCSVEFHPENAMVFGNNRRKLWIDGKNVDVGHLWTNIDLLTSAQAFSNSVKSLDEIKERWSGSVLPSIVHLADYEATPQEAVKQFVSDLKQTAEAAKIEKTGEGTAKELAVKLSSSGKDAAATMASYTGNR